MKSHAGPSTKLPDAFVVKPKLEPGEGSLQAPLDADEDQVTTPLSGHRPFFTAIMAKTHVEKPYQLVRRRNASSHSYRNHLGDR
jgi:hypothetical protein